MNEGLIPKRYAKALYEYASDKGDTARMYELMKNLDRAFAAAPDIQKALANPFVSSPDKSALIAAAAGAKADNPVFVAFTALLARNKRFPLVRQIALAYLDAYRTANNIKVVALQSAAKLDPVSEAKLKNLIAAHLGGSTMEYTSSVNPDLIGGFTVQTGNERLDASVANELKQLRLNLISK